MFVVAVYHFGRARAKVRARAPKTAGTPKTIFLCLVKAVKYSRSETCVAASSSPVVVADMELSVSYHLQGCSAETELVKDLGPIL